MSTSKLKPAKSGRTIAKFGSTYRGIRLQHPTGRSQFTRDQIIHAVEAAIAKHADALARKP